MVDQELYWNKDDKNVNGRRKQRWKNLKKNKLSKFSFNNPLVSSHVVDGINVFLNFSARNKIPTFKINSMQLIFYFNFYCI